MSAIYELKDPRWIEGNGRKVYLKQAPTVYEESFMSIVGEHSLLQEKVDINEGYEEAKVRLGKPEIEAYDLGGLCSQYDNFSFCNNGQDNDIGNISMLIDPTFTIKDIKEILGDPTDSYLMDVGMEYYVHTYELGDQSITYSTENADPNSLIDEILLMPMNWEEQ